MRLRKVFFRRFMQFVDETLDLDPNVTVLVGRNDSGKTNVLRWFFDQHVTGAIHGRAKSLVKGHQDDPISFALTWQTETGDTTRFPLKDAFGRENISRFTLSFTDHSTDGKDFKADADGTSVNPYRSEPNEHGLWVLREAFASNDLFPQPYYLSLDEEKTLPTTLQARFYEPSPSSLEAIFHRDSAKTEVMLLRLAGLRAETRPIPAGLEPWSPMFMPRSPLTLGEINDRLNTISAELSKRLATWWRDPEGLRFRLSLAGSQDAKEHDHRANSYTLSWGITDKEGIPYYGTGLRWFLSLLVDWLWLEATADQQLVLIDEPAYSLHPSAQRVVARLFSVISERHQVVYATHSPFIIDWSFPQRVRLLERDPITKRARIQNRPYHAQERFQTVWDPLREAIGVSLGDLAVIGNANVLVEGVSDQILLANAASILRQRGNDIMNPNEINIIPFGDIPTLLRLLERIRSRGARAVVLCDSDDEGKEIVRLCAKASVRVLQVGGYVDGWTPSWAASIEDILGVERYEGAINRYYAPFEWFGPLVPSSESRDGRSLGSFAEAAFESKFGRGFDKIGIAISIVQLAAHEEDQGLMDLFVPLLTAIAEALKASDPSTS